MKQETTDFGRQLKALLKRNVLLKRREPIQTLFVSSTLQLSALYY